MGGSLARAERRRSARSMLTVASRPDLVADWGKNTAAPEQVALNENVDVAWVCHLCGHGWVATLAGRLRGGLCPSCRGTGEYREMRLGRARPDLAREWHFGLNQPHSKAPGWVSLGVTYRRWWVCSYCDHVWSATVWKRVHGGGCPKCTATHSREETHLVAEIAGWVPVAVGEHTVQVPWSRTPDGTEPSNRTNGPGRRRVLNVDVLVPDWRLAIEYDGAYWHADRVAADAEKTARLTAVGWRVLRLREAPLPLLPNVDQVVVESRAYGATARTVLRWCMEQGYPVTNPDALAYLADPTNSERAAEAGEAAYLAQRVQAPIPPNANNWRAVSVVPMRPEQVAIPGEHFQSGVHHEHYRLMPGETVGDWVARLPDRKDMVPSRGFLHEHMEMRPLPEDHTDDLGMIPKR
jgi:rubrerythrin